MGLVDYLKMIEYQILAYSLFIGAVSIYFWSTLFPDFKVDVPLSVCSGLFLLVVAGAGFAAVFASNDRLKVLYAYFLILQIILCFIFAIVSGVTVKKEEVDKRMSEELKEYIKKDGLALGSMKFLTKVQQALKCCATNDQQKGDEEESSLLGFIGKVKTKIADPTPEDYRNFANSCCDGEIAKDDICTPKHEKYYTSTCEDAFNSRINTYKAVAIAMYVLAMVFQGLLFFSYYKNAQN